MNNLQEKLDFLLKKYNVSNTAILQGKTSVKIENETVSLLPHRNERRFAELKNMVNDGTLKGISVMRVCRIDKKNTNINDIIYREFDICEWIIGSEITEIMTYKNGCTANIVAKMKNGVVCTIEVAATLSGDAVPIDKHEIITQRGIACDRVVDTQVPQNSIYVFSEEKVPQTYTDTDFELFGLDLEEVALVRQAFEAAKNKVVAGELNKSAKHIQSLVELSEKSVDTSSNILCDR